MNGHKKNVAADLPLPRGQYKLCVQSNHYMTFISWSVT